MLLTHTGSSQVWSSFIVPRATTYTDHHLINLRSLRLLLIFQSTRKHACIHVCLTDCYSNPAPPTSLLASRSGGFGRCRRFPSPRQLPPHSFCSLSALILSVLVSCIGASWHSHFTGVCPQVTLIDIVSLLHAPHPVKKRML